MSGSFAGKQIVFGVTGSIAAFKGAGWVSTLTQAGADISVVMTRSATQFVSPLTFSALSGNKTCSDMFEDEKSSSISHIDLATTADCIVIAPATAQTISRLANGFADDLLTAIVLATSAPVIICPAMNSNMFAHPATQNNIDKLRSFGYQIVDPEYGSMACKTEGQGRLVSWETAREVILRALSEQDLKDHHVLVTAGPTRETIDAARFLSNRSSGKMGYALAAASYRRGAEVTLISGPTSLSPPHGVNTLQVQTAQEMYDQLFDSLQQATIVIKAAAVSDFRSKNRVERKIKKHQAELELALEANPDILAEIGKKRTSSTPFLVGFCAETENMLEEAQRKLKEKRVDLICANDISGDDTGFGVDTNRVTMVDHNKHIQLPMVLKEETANLILDRVVELLG